MQVQLSKVSEVKKGSKGLSHIPALVYVLPGYFLAAAIFTYPLVTVLGRTVTDPVDPILNTWILAWAHHALLTQPLELLNANIFYPYEQSLLYSETLLLPMATLLPLRVATGNPILTHNLLVLLGLASTAGSGYLLGRWLFRNHGSGLLVGLVLAFNSHTLGNIGQAQLLNIAWLPLALLYVGRLLNRPHPRAALFLAFFLAAQFYTVIYYGIFGFLLVGLAGGIGWLLKPFPSSATRWAAFGLLIGSLLVAVLLCLPLALPYYTLSQTHGLERTLADTWPFSTSLEMWLMPSAQSLLYGALGEVDLLRLGFYTVATLFPGVLLIVLAASGLCLWLWQASGIAKPSANFASNRIGARYAPFLLLGIGFFFLLSLGPYLQVRTLQPNFGQVLPYAWIHEWIPGFHALRAPGRFATVVFLGLAIAAGYALMQISWRSLQALLLALLMVESLSIPLSDLYTPTIQSTDRQAFHRWLETQPETVYLELPISSPGLDEEAERWLENQFASLSHWQPTLGGYSGFWPPQHDNLLLFVSQFPQREAVLFLQELGVEWVFVSKERLSADEWHEIESAVDEHGWETQRWESSLAVRLPKRTARRPEITYAVPDKAQMGGELTVDAIFTSKQPVSILPDSELGRLRAEWRQAERRILVTNKTYQPPFFVDPVAVSPVSIPVPQSSGLHTLSIYDHDERLIIAADVNVTEDIAPPETTLLPLHGLEATLSCDEGGAQIAGQMRTIGWYQQPFTLSARVLDKDGTELMRSAADVEFPAQRPRSNLHSVHAYTLPLTAVPSPDAGVLIIEFIGYRWQQNAERIVPRHFVTADGSIVPTLRLPLPVSSTCAGSEGLP